MKNTISFLVLALMFVFAGCKPTINIDNTAAYANFDVACLGVDGDGSQTLRVFGKGKSRTDAIDQAKRNAVMQILFKGITAGSGECNKRPLVTEVNGRERHEQYFNKFFANGGAYNKYVSLDEKRTSRIKASAKAQEQWGVVVTVDRPALLQQLKDDGIVK